MEAALGERRTLELSLTGRIFAAAEARELGLVHEVAEDASARALRDRPRRGRTSVPTAVQKGIGFVQQARGLDPQAAGDIAPRGAESGLCRSGLPRGTTRLPREARAPVAVHVEGVPEVPLNICGYAILHIVVLPSGTLRVGVGVLYFCAERV